MRGCGRRSPTWRRGKAAERHNSKQAALRLKQLAKVGKRKVLELAKELHAKGKEATQTAVLRLVNDEWRQERRKASRAAPVSVDGMDLRIGDCREVLAGVADSSVVRTGRRADFSSAAGKTLA